MSHKIQVIVADTEWPIFQAEAANAGLSLSAWFRAAAQLQVDLAQQRPRLATPAALQTFFAECAGRESGAEPDWQQHKDVLNRSRHMEIT